MHTKASELYRAKQVCNGRTQLFALACVTVYLTERYGLDRMDRHREAMVRAVEHMMEVDDGEHGYGPRSGPISGAGGGVGRGVDPSVPADGQRSGGGVVDGLDWGSVHGRSPGWVPAGVAGRKGGDVHGGLETRPGQGCADQAGSEEGE